MGSAVRWSAVDGRSVKQTGNRIGRVVAAKMGACAAAGAFRRLQQRKAEWIQVHWGPAGAAAPAPQQQQRTVSCAAASVNRFELGGVQPQRRQLTLPQLGVKLHHPGVCRGRGREAAGVGPRQPLLGHAAAARACAAAGGRAAAAAQRTRAQRLRRDAAQDAQPLQRFDAAARGAGGEQGAGRRPQQRQTATARRGTQHAQPNRLALCLPELT